jgi:hypothetical protein
MTAPEAERKTLHLRRDRLAEYHVGELVDTASFLYGGPYRSWWVTRTDLQAQILELVGATQEELEAANGTSKVPTMSHISRADNLTLGTGPSAGYTDICQGIRRHQTKDGSPQYQCGLPRLHAGQRIIHKHHVYRLGHSWKRRRCDTVRIWALHDPYSGERQSQGPDTEIEDIN